MMKIFRKDVSDDEVKQAMVVHINEMFKHVRPRVQVKLKEDDDKAASKTKVNLGGRGIPRDEKDLLLDIFEKPNLSVTKRGSRLGLSAYKMNNLKRSVLKKGLVEQFSANLGKRFGGKITLLTLTPAGCKALEKELVIRPSNVSAEHWWWQTNIKDYFLRKGIATVIEKSMNNTRADVGLVRDGEDVAVEVELTPKNAVANITSDLDAGFDRVVCCCKDNMVAREVRRRLKEHKRYEFVKDSVEVKVLTELQLVKELYNKKQ
jgi:hypothetical protein